jgi:uncharacterized protein YjbJ (UPF0337 family)
MNQDVLTGQWKQMRGELKAWWGKLADDDFERIGGQKDKLIGAIQEKYGYAREKAQQEVERRLQEYGDKMNGPSSRGKQAAAAAGASGSANTPNEGPIATAVAAVASGVESAQGAVSTAATAVADGLESAQGALATGWESAQGAASTAATAVADGLESAQGALSTGWESAQGAVSTAATAVAGGVESASSYLQEKKIDEMATDLTALIRTYPLQSLLVGMGVGYLLARLTSR